MSSLMLVYGAALLLRVVVWLSLRKWAKNPSPHLIYKARLLPPLGAPQDWHKWGTSV